MKRTMRSLLGWAFIGALAALCNTCVWAQEPAAGPQYVYANDDIVGSNTIEGFSLDVNTGLLVAISGSPFPTGGSGVGGGFFAAPKIIARFTGNFIYVSNGGSNNISVFKISPRTGIPALIGSPVSTGGSGATYGIGMAVSPNGQFLFAGNGGSNNISAFSINSTTGELTAVPGSPFPTNDNPDGLLVMPNSMFLLVGQPNSATIAVFSIGPRGTLTPVAGSPFPAAGAAAGLDADAKGRHIFVGDASNTESIEVYTQSLTGAITPVRGSPFTFTYGVNSNVVLLSPNGKFLFVSNQGSTTVTKLAINQASGVLSGVAGDPFTDGNPGDAPAGMGINRAGTLLFTSDFNPGASHINVLGVTENPDGTETLTPVPGSPFPTMISCQTSLVAFPGKKPIDPASPQSPSPAGPEDTIHPH
jgi:6-phosphogluconolactonase